MKKIKKLKILIYIILVLIVSNVTVFYVNQINVNDKVNLILEEDLNTLKINYKSLLSHQRQIADSFYDIIMQKDGFIELYTQILHSSSTEKNNLRKKLQSMILSEYNIMRRTGVLQFQFVSPDNISFLRMHNLDKYDDDLSKVRQDIVNTNKNKTISRGLVKGKTIHGFRNVYPIFNDNGQYLGIMEISFDSDSFQDNLTKMSGLHAHFLIHKNSFNISEMYIYDKKSKYVQSSENFDYMVSLSTIHNKSICIVDNHSKLKVMHDEIFQKMNKSESFSFYVRNKDFEIEIISFLPIKEFDSQKATGWIVSYSKNPFINEILQTGNVINLFSIFILCLFAFFVYQQIIAEIRIKQEHTLLDDVINTSEDMIFVTDFKTISFFNKKFRDYLDVRFVDEIEDVTSLFINMHGYLHNELLNKNEKFYELITRTTKEDRIVCLIDKSMNPRAFTISTAQSSYTKGDYLVTLTDITKLKERELSISNKAFYDGLTGVYNRNKFDELMAIELKRDIRYKNNLSIAIVDIDHFKNFNDTYGHLIGDEVLVMIAEYLNNNVRETDIFARWGGEEFVILFPETSSEDARVVCEKLRLGIMKLEHKIAGSVTASFGITQYKDKDVLASIFKRCDDALYASKQTGRNKVSIK